MTENKPLVLDVDGTFLATDLLYEGFWATLGRRPGVALDSLKVMGGRVDGPARARIKRALAEATPLRLDLMPVTPSVLELARAAEAEGREVILASASDHILVDALARHYGFSARVFASDGATNMGGATKAAALVEAFGEGGFDYAGNSSTDRAVWAVADHAYVVGDEASARWLEGQGKPVTRLAPVQEPGAVGKALRPHQWVKNVLLFVPLLAGHDFGLTPFLMALAGMVAFSLAASSIYVVNDLTDLEADRLHETKCRRPFAAGTATIQRGMLASAGAGGAALLIAAILSLPFMVAVAVYMALSLAYSLRLKRARWVDIFALAALYTLRVAAGALASGVGISLWLLGFIFPVFLTLGAVKRMIELARAKTADRLPGRGYGRADRPQVLNFATGAMVVGLIAFFGYSFSDQAAMLYPTRWLLWLALVPIGAWMLRMVRLGWQGRMDYDPIVFALSDKRGIGLMLLALGLMFQAAGLWAKWFGAAF